MDEIIEKLVLNGNTYNIRYGGKYNKTAGKTYYNYHVSVSYGTHPISGKQMQRQLTGNTLEEVKEKLLLELGLKTPENASHYKNITYAEWLEYIEKLKSISYTTSSKLSIKSTIKTKILPYLGSKKLVEITEDDLLCYFKELRSTRTRTNQIRYIHSLINKSFEVAVNKKIINLNPCMDIEMPRAEYTEKLPLWQEQYEEFVKLAKETPYYELYITLLSTGLRIGEALGLSWNDVLSNRNELFIHQQVQQRDEDGKSCRKINPITKSKRSRFVPYSNELEEIFQSRKAKQQEDMRKNPEKWNNEYNLVFTDAYGVQLPYYAVQKSFRTVADSLGRMDLTIHSLRHTYLSFTYDETNNIIAVQKVGGHKSLGTTAGYIHLTSKQKRELEMANSKMFKQMHGEVIENQEKE